MDEKEKKTKTACKVDKRYFTEFLLDSGALIFGDFTLKSGRRSPYMINTGQFNTGPKLARLSCFYAKTIREKRELGILPERVDLIFGAAYKGIPLAAAVAVAFSAAFDEEIGYCFNRKEEKDHGEGSRLVGRAPKPGDNVLIIDDVMTAGTALRETVAILHAEAPGARIVGCVLAVDRAERGREKLSAIAEAQYENGFPVFAIADTYDILDALRAGALSSPEEISAIEAYLENYGLV